MELSNELIERSSKNLIEEPASVLARMVAGYQAQFGQIPVEQLLRFLRVDKLTDEDARMTVSGLETYCGSFGTLREEMPDITRTSPLAESNRPVSVWSNTISGILFDFDLDRQMCQVDQGTEMRSPTASAELGAGYPLRAKAKGLRRD